MRHYKWRHENDDANGSSHLLSSTCAKVLFQVLLQVLLHLLLTTSLRLFTLSPFYLQMRKLLQRVAHKVTQQLKEFLFYLL